jgi:raffinose/stachyose/melibiose transport system substrate-binding protein
MHRKLLLFSRALIDIIGGQKMKKSLTFILAGIFIIASIAGCGTATTKAPATSTVEVQATAATKQPETVKEPTKIKFLCNETPLLTKDFWKVVADDYTKVHPEVTIEEIFEPAGVQLFDYEKTLLATGAFPDVMVMATPGDFVPSGSLLALEDKDLDIINPDYLSSMGGKYYVLPYKVQVGGVFYNKKIFADNGLNEPKTFKDLTDICDKLKSKNITPIVVGMKESFGQLLPWIYTASANMSANPSFAADRKAGKVTFAGTPEFVTAAKQDQILMSKYTNSDKGSMSYAQSTEYFFGGKAGMYIMGSWAQGDDTKLSHDFEVGFFGMPNESGNTAMPVAANEGLSISASCKNPEVAKDFIKFFITDTDFAGKFLQTEQLFGVTKQDIAYEKSPLHSIVEAKVQETKGVENFYDQLGDNTWYPGVTDLFGKLSVKIAADPKVNIEAEIKNLDSEFDKLKANATNK